MLMQPEIQDLEDHDSTLLIKLLTCVEIFEKDFENDSARRTFLEEDNNVLMITNIDAFIDDIILLIFSETIHNSQR